jgi:hypothetical protein
MARDETDRNVTVLALIHVDWHPGGRRGQEETSGSDPLVARAPSATSRSRAALGAGSDLLSRTGRRPPVRHEPQWQIHLTSASYY